jgi:hypothetical protein
MNDKTTATKQAPEKALATFGPEIDLFCKHIDAIGDVLILMVMAVQKITEKLKEDMTEFENEKCEVSEDVNERTVKIPNNQFREWKRHAKTYEHFNLSRELLPRSLLVSLISQYDAFLGRILRTAFIRKPEILKASEKKISFDVLSQFSSIEAVREYILEKEVEAILRSSHADQFKWMETTFGLPLTKDLLSWPAFIELTERRNLFVHTDGVVSSQYIAVCKLYKCKLEDDMKEGDRLDVPQDYFTAAHHNIFEIGVKLGHVMWRKLLPDERSAADNHLVRVTYELIENGKWDLALRLLDFACTEFKKFSNEGVQLTLTVNRAQAYKWKGDDERCKKIMRAVDWSARSDQFRLADAVLLEDWPLSARMMRRIGKDGAVHQNDYRDWPLFREFRKQQMFLDTYEQIFETPFPKRSEVKRKEASDQLASEPTATSEDPPPKPCAAEPSIPPVAAR